MTIRHPFLLTFMALTGLLGKAQAPRSSSSADILQQLQQLKVLGSVLYVGAHPDDENTRLLAYLAKERKVRTAYLSMTRGDGGQNLLGDEQGIELGLIRTQELLAARRVDGAEQFFTRAYDFGFSKSPKEALRIWGEDSILADVVWVIRMFQPDVIITRFPEDGRAGHGHHSASAILAREAFAAAADSTRFPEQFNYGVRPWKAKRILWNTFNFGGLNTTSEDQLKVDIGGFNEILGKSYGEIAAESRSQHKSQGFGVAATRGPSYEYFTPIAGDPPGKDLLDGVTTDWSRVGAPGVNQEIDSLIANFNALHPSASLPALERLTARVQEMPEGYWRNYKLRQLHLLENACSGLWTEAYVSRPYLVRGEHALVTVSMINRGAEPATVTHIMIGMKDTAMRLSLPPNENVNITVPVNIVPNAMLSQPYWLEREKEEGRFTVAEQSKIGLPQNGPALPARIGIEQNGTREVNLAVMYRHTDPVRGELYQPLQIVPALLVYFVPSPILDNLHPVYHPALRTTVVAMTNVHARDLSITLSNGKDSITVGKGPAELEKDKTYEFDLPYNEQFMKSMRGSTFDVRVHIQATDTAGGSGSVAATGTYSTGMKEIDYQHIPFIHYFHNTTSKVVGEQIKVQGKRIGYIVGAGDKMPGCLELMGYEVTFLREQDVRGTDLSSYDAIITGVRAFNTQPWLRGVLAKLMKYVENGGVLLEQYNNANGIAGLPLGPYPFHVGTGRVTDENATVSFLDQANPALHFPNEITNADFDGWVQERGLYFVDVPASTGADPQYQAVLGMGDPGESLQKGALITVLYGKGKFVYTSLSFFRQLPAGVPGAYRLFANLLARPKPPVK